MLAAAYRLFCEKGYPATTMDAIAREAGVAVQTLYFTFGTKAQIISDTLGAAIMGFDEYTPMPEQFDASQEFKTFMTWFPAFEAEPDPHRALAIFVKGGADIFQRTAPLARALDAAAADPEVASVQRVAEERRYDGFREIVRLLAKKGGVRAGVTQARATDIVLVLYSAETYNALVAGRGWSHAECIRWMIDVLSRQILPER
jgi:AcrR family transcriptional regulator